MMVLFGQSSGVVPPFSASVFAQKGSLFFTRPTLFHYVADRAQPGRAREESWARSATATEAPIGATFPLAAATGDAPRARGSPRPAKCC
jgi:NADPH2:quinone reductase